jgi:hypothetical protein
VHVILGLVAETCDFTELEVELVDDGPDELRQVPDKARDEGMLEDTEALALEFRVAQGAALVVNLGVDDDADGQDGVVAVVLLLVVDQDDGPGVLILDGLVFLFQVVDGVFERGHVTVAWAVELYVVLRIIVCVVLRIVVCIVLHIIVCIVLHIVVRIVLGRGLRRCICCSELRLAFESDVLEGGVVDSGEGSSGHGVGAVRVALLGLRARGFADLDGRFWSRFGLEEFRGKKNLVHE